MTTTSAATAHPHGTRHRYRHGCRCEPCRTANQRAEQMEVRRRGLGIDPPTAGNAAPVRDHIQALLDRGYSLQSIADTAQICTKSLTGILRGTLGRPAPVHISSRAAEAVLAVQPAALDAAVSGRVLVGAAGTMRRLQALVALGWTQSRLASELATTPGQMSDLMARARVQASTASAVRDLYARLEHQPPPEDTPREKSAAGRARLRARKAGWPKPAEWDDGLIDLPAEELEAELRSQAEAMDDAAVRSCHTSVRHGDIAPLTVAGAREYFRRRHRIEAKARARKTSPIPTPERTRA